MVAPPPRRGAQAWQDALFEGNTRFFADRAGGAARYPDRAGDVRAAGHAKFGPAFFVTDVWNPVTLQFGGLAPIYGTLVTSAIALLIGVPAGFGSRSS